VTNTSSLVKLYYNNNEISILMVNFFIQGEYKALIAIVGEFFHEICRWEKVDNKKIM